MSTGASPSDGARVGLLRHGETTGEGFCGAGSDVPLTARGQAAMEGELARRRPPGLASGEPAWDRIVTSPLQRCQGPASAWAERWDVPLVVEPRLKELHFGAWEGRSAAALMETDADALGRFWQDPEGCPPPQGEALGAFRERVLAGWRESVATPGTARTLVVTHGGVIRVLRAHFEGIPLAELLSIEAPLAVLHWVDPARVQA